MTTRSPQLIGIAILCAATGAWAQSYKCVGPDGKTIFSDQRCETLPPGAPPVPGKPGASDKGARTLSAADQERVKALDAIASNRASNGEQKTAAMLEAGNIRRGLEGQMSQADRDKREQLTKELASADGTKRAAALRDLRALYRD